MCKLASSIKFELDNYLKKGHVYGSVNGHSEFVQYKPNVSFFSSYFRTTLFVSQVQDSGLGRFLHEYCCDPNWCCDYHYHPHRVSPIIVVFADDVGASQWSERWPQEGSHDEEYGSSSAISLTVPYIYNRSFDAVSWMLPRHSLQ